MSVAAESTGQETVKSSAVLANRVTAVLAWGGVFVAGTLAVAHLTERIVPCGVSKGCETVAQHASSRWFDVPVAVIGLIGYIILAALSIMRSTSDAQMWRKLTTLSLAGTSFGFFASVYFMYTAVAVIEATCQWCVASAVIMTASLIATAWLWTCAAPQKSVTRVDAVLHAACAILAIGSVGVVSVLMENSLDVPSPTIGSLSETDILPNAAKVRGDASAPVTIIEFADFNCGGCRAAAEVMDKLYKEAKGKIRWAYRNYPLVKLAGHETSMHAATLSELAAEKGVFWTFLDNAFLPANTERMKSVVGVKQIGIESGLKIGDINAALNRESSSAKAVTVDLDLALRVNIKQTPTFLILAKGVEPKAVSGRRLEAVLRGTPYKEKIWGN